MNYYTFRPSTIFPWRDMPRRPHFHVYLPDGRVVRCNRKRDAKRLAGRNSVRQWRGSYNPRQSASAPVGTCYGACPYVRDNRLQRRVHVGRRGIARRLAL